MYFNQKEPIKVQILRLSNVWVKIRQISHVIFQSKSQFLLKFFIILQCFDT